MDPVSPSSVVAEARETKPRMVRGVDQVNSQAEASGNENNVTNNQAEASGNKNGTGMTTRSRGVLRSQSFNESDSSVAEAREKLNSVGKMIKLSIPDNYNESFARNEHLLKLRNAAASAISKVVTENKARNSLLTSTLRDNNNSLQSELSDAFINVNNRIEERISALPIVAMLSTDSSGTMRITPFNGSSESCGQFSMWLRRLEDILRARAATQTDEQKANFLICHLEGVAREKVEELTDAQKKNYDDVVNHLRVYCEGPQQKHLARQHLSSCKQHAGESAVNFASRVLNLLRAVTAGQDTVAQKERALEEFVARLRPEIRFHRKNIIQSEYKINLVLNQTLPVPEGNETKKVASYAEKAASAKKSRPEGRATEIVQNDTPNVVKEGTTNDASKVGSPHSEASILVRTTSELSLQGQDDSNSEVSVESEFTNTFGEKFSASPVHERMDVDEDPYNGGTEHRPFTPEQITSWAEEMAAFQQSCIVPAPKWNPEPPMPVGSDINNENLPVGSGTKIYNFPAKVMKVDGEPQFVEVTKKVKNSGNGNPESRGTKRSGRSNKPRIPAKTPAGHTHPWINHPLGKFFKPRSRTISNLNENNTTEQLDTRKYKHLPSSGYNKSATVKGLYPKNEYPAATARYRLPFIEIPGIAEASEFITSADQVRETLMRERENFVREERKHLKQDTDTRQECIIPPMHDGKMPVVYQIVELKGQFAVAESKDFLVCLPNRDLHCITFDQMAYNVVSGNRGYCTKKLSNKDHIFVYSVEPTQAALKKPDIVFESSKRPRAATLDNERQYFWRVKAFAFVKEQSTFSDRLGVVLTVPPVGAGARNNSIHAAFEGAPEAVKISKVQCKNPKILSEVQVNDPIIGSMRKNISTAIRFSEPPVSRKAMKELATMVRDFIPAFAEEGMTPMEVDHMPQETIDWVVSRVNNFNFTPEDATFKNMARCFNFGCSVVAAHARLQEDRRTHNTQLRAENTKEFPLKCNFTIPEMGQAAGWEKGRMVMIWIVGTDFGAMAEVQGYQSYNGSITIRVIFPGREARHVAQALENRGVSMQGTTGKPHSYRADIRARLSRSAAVADPVFELISREDLVKKVNNDQVKELFSQIYDKNLAEASVSKIIEGKVRPTAALVKGKRLNFAEDQVAAIALGCSNQRIATIQAAWGTGKTTVGAYIMLKNLPLNGNGINIATATTNSAVAAFALALHNLGDEKLRPIQFISETAQHGEVVSTPYDVLTLMTQLGVTIGQDVMSDEENETCRKFRKDRENIQDLLARGDTVDEATRDEYLLSEEELSETMENMLALLVQYYRPNFWCVTTASLVNLTIKDRPLHKYKNSIEFLVVDEASQVAESVFITLLTRFSKSRFLLIGDVKQLQPHVRMERDLIPTRLGAKGTMEVLMVAPAVPTSRLITSFRSHPKLVGLSNGLFYENDLMTGAILETKVFLLEAFSKPRESTPFFYYNVEGKGIQAASKSLYNEAEKEKCLKLIMFLSNFFSPKNITVISFYKEQLRRLETEAATIGFDLSTVDSVQGRENEVVILLTTRSEFAAQQTNFISEPHRLNVALTRCKQGMILLGNIGQLAAAPLWKDVIQWAKKNGHELTDKDITTESLRPPNDRV